MPPASEWDEADLLRAAGVILDVLSDHEVHSWRSIRQDVAAGSGLHPRLASDLAYAALTSYLSDVDLRWLGEPGQRMVYRPLADDVVVAMACPRCLAAPGDRCVRLKGNGKPTETERVRFHEEREHEAVAAVVVEMVSEVWEGRPGS
ncbi:MAG: hypothetical protein WKF94_18065 [Solirubrobacteraceae bacterium]